MSNIDYNKNGITLLRYFACIQVIIGHINFCMGLNIDDAIINATMVFQGVPVFFVISGYLVWISLEHHYDFREYINNRLRRIYPELWIAVIISIVSIIIFYEKPIKVKELILFIFTQSTLFQFWTPSFLRDYGVGTPNGALWTICIFMQFYVVIYFLHKNIIITGGGGQLFLY